MPKSTRDARHWRKGKRLHEARVAGIASAVCAHVEPTVAIGKTVSLTLMDAKARLTAELQARGKMQHASF